MNSGSIRKKEGFAGQKAIVIPRKILAAQCAANNVISHLYITDIGYYPKAKFHYMERPHGAEQNILIYCHEGSGTVKINRTLFAVKAGEYILVPRKAIHLYSADTGNPWTIYWIHFKGEAGDALVNMQQEKTGSYKGAISNSESILTVFKEMYATLERGYSNDHLMHANMSLYRFLSTCIFYSNQADKKVIKDASNIAIDFMASRINHLLTLENIATIVNLSPSHFSFIFKKKTGYSPIDYFNHLKMQKACQYLLFTNLRIKEIAAALGIEDPYYFSRLFTKIMGIAPNQYREKRIH